VLLVLLAFFAGAAYLVARLHEDAMAVDEPGPPIVGRVPEARARDGGGTWRRHRWSGADAPPAPIGGPANDGPRPADPRGHDRLYDPQRTAMSRSFGRDGDAGAALPFAPVTRAARIVRHEGALAVPPDAACEVRVLPVRSGRFNCLVRVLCGGEVLYPNPSQTAGYVPCTLEDGAPLAAEDRGHTALDGDPRVRLDLREGTVTVEDRGDGVAAFSATLRIR
jgi:hypothetical protein